MELFTQTLGQISPTANPRLAKQIQDRLDTLTKPRGSLGRLEEIVLQYGLARGESRLPPPRKSLFVFCAGHGVTAEGVSAYPREVTYQMVRNFVSGGAAINVLCRQCGIEPVIVDMGVDHDLASIAGVVRRKVAPGTRNFLREPAMTRDLAVQSIETGIALARAAASLEFGLLGVGEMGIGNTTSASAVLGPFQAAPPQTWWAPARGSPRAGFSTRPRSSNSLSSCITPTLPTRSPFWLPSAALKSGASAGFAWGPPRHACP